MVQHIPKFQRSHSILQPMVLPLQPKKAIPHYLTLSDNIKPGVNYINVQREEYLAQRQEVIKLATKFRPQ